MTVLQDNEIKKNFNEKKFSSNKYYIFIILITLIGLINICLLFHFTKNLNNYNSNKSLNNTNIINLNNEIIIKENLTSYQIPNENFSYITIKDELNHSVNQEHILDILVANKQKLLLLFVLFINIIVILVLICEKSKKNFFKKFNSLIFNIATIFSIVSFILQLESIKINLNLILYPILHKRETYIYLNIFLQSSLNIARILYFDNSFIVNLISSIIAFFVLFIFEFWKFSNDYLFIIDISIYLFWITIIYKLDCLEKNIFVLFQKLNKNLKKTNNLLDNLSSGLVSIKANKIIDFNSKINDFGNFRKNTGIEYIFNPLDIKNFIFTELKEFNPELNPKLLENFHQLNSLRKNENDGPTEKDYENLMKNLTEFSSYFIDDFVFIAKKTYFITRKNPRELTLQIFIKYSENDDKFEILVTDISNIVKNEELNAQNKYKKLFLNKFSHEFKNPILNINQLIKDFRSYIKNNDDHSFKNLPFSLKERWNEILNKSTRLKHANNICNLLTTLITDFDILANIDLINFNPSKNFGTNNANTTKTFSKYISNTNTGFNKFITINKHQVNIRKIMKFCFKIFSTRIELNEKNLDINYHIDETIPEYIISDERRLKQILINIISNSYKFTNNGFIDIKVLRNNNGDFKSINFIIEDSGNGIKPDILNNICEPYRKLDIESNIYGAGLGLFIVKILVDQLGSNLEITSEIQKGTKISFLLDICYENDIEYFKDSIDSSKKLVRENIKNFHKNFDNKKKSPIKYNSHQAHKKPGRQDVYDINSINNEVSENVIRFNSLNSLNNQSFPIKINSISKEGQKIINYNGIDKYQSNEINNSHDSKITFIHDSPNFSNLNSNNNKKINFVNKNFIKSGVFENKSYTLNLLKKFTKISENLFRRGNKFIIKNKYTIPKNEIIVGDLKRSVTDFIDSKKYKKLDLNSNDSLNGVNFNKSRVSNFKIKSQQSYNTTINTNQIKNNLNSNFNRLNLPSSTNRANLNINFSNMNLFHTKINDGSNLGSTILNSDLHDKNQQINLNHNQESNLSDQTQKVNSPNFRIKYKKLRSTICSNNNIKYTQYKVVNQETSPNSIKIKKNNAILKELINHSNNLNIDNVINSENFSNKVNFEFSGKKFFYEKDYDIKNNIVNVKNSHKIDTINQNNNFLNFYRRDQNDSDNSFMLNENSNNLSNVSFIKKTKENNRKFENGYLNFKNKISDKSILSNFNKNQLARNENNDNVYDIEKSSRTETEKNIPKFCPQFINQNLNVLEFKEKSNQKNISENRSDSQNIENPELSFDSSNIVEQSQFMLAGDNKAKSDDKNTFHINILNSGDNSNYHLNLINSNNNSLNGSIDTTSYQETNNDNINEKFNIFNNSSNSNRRSNFVKENTIFENNNNFKKNEPNIIDHSFRNFKNYENEDLNEDQHENLEIINFNTYNSDNNNFIEVNNYNELPNKIQNQENSDDCCNEDKRIFRVLLVDDEKLIRESEVSVLKKFFNKNKEKFNEIEIHQCIDGVECLFEIWLHLQQGIKFDAIITDQSMNFMRGSLLAQIIRDLVKENVMYEIKIFMVTSYEPHMITTNGANVLDEIYTKPLSMDNIRSICNKF